MVEWGVEVEIFGPVYGSLRERIAAVVVVRLVKRSSFLVSSFRGPRSRGVVNPVCQRLRCPLAELIQHASILVCVLLI